MISPSKRHSLGVNDWVAEKELKRCGCYEKSVLLMMHLFHGESVEVLTAAKRLQQEPAQLANPGLGQRH